MQDLLNQLSTPVAIGLLVVGLVVLVLVVLLARRRRRQAPPEDAGASSLGSAIDYTALPLDEEPQGWRDRFNRLPLAGRILAILVPLLVLLGLAVLVLTLLPNGQPPPPPPPTPVPVTLTIFDAALIRAEPPTVSVIVDTTGLRNNTELVAELQEDGAAFAWLQADEARTVVRNDRAEFTARRAEGAQTPQRDKEYTVVVRTADGAAVSAPFKLLVPAPLAGAFFNDSAPVAAEPTATAEPRPTSDTAPTATAEPSPTPAATLPTGPAAQVSNGGNVRKLPFPTAENVVGGINAGEQVQLLARTPNGEWYKVRTIRDEIGWSSVTLIGVDAATAAQIPIANVVSVFVNGAVYEQPDSASTQLDRVNVGEVVELKRKTAAGDWYEVLNVRDISGWVPAELLGVPDEVAAQVPTQ